MSSEPAQRAGRIGLLARARPESLARLMAAFEPGPARRWLRPPEIGLVMTRGRAGATGDAFNLGETTATRCALRLDTGETGFACVLGRDKAHAERAALADALLQTEAGAAVARDVLEPLAEEEAARRAAQARRAAATKVEFFTMTRGEG